jgi:hypothetical protein
VGVPLVEIIFIIWLRLSKGVCELARYTIREVGTIKDFDLSDCQYMRLVYMRYAFAHLTWRWMDVRMSPSSWWWWAYYCLLLCTNMGASIIKWNTHVGCLFHTSHKFMNIWRPYFLFLMQKSLVLSSKNVKSAYLLNSKCMCEQFNS